MNRGVALTCVLVLLSITLGAAALRAQSLTASHQVFLPLVSQDGPSAKVNCVQQSDGTMDCSNVFMEVGTPSESPTLQAAACNGANDRPGFKGCDGQDPYAMRCAVSYGVIDMSYIYDNSGKNIGYVQLWWSNTCQTNWARAVRTTPSSFYVIYASVYRDDNFNREMVDVADKVFTASGGTATSVYTRMVYAPYRPALAEGSLDTDGPYTFHGITRWH